MDKIIKFRGKNIHTGEWLYGDYHREGKTHYITKPEQYLGEYAPIEFIVDEKTVGQFTELFDRTGKNIFEGDILQCPSVPNIQLEVRYNTMQGAFCLVEHTHTEGALLGTSPLGKMLRHYPDMRIIGNRFDNPLPNKRQAMKTNIATDSSQSQRLLRCGVSADTADMIGIEPNYGYECEPWSSMQGQDTRGYFPAWSLSKMLGLLPKEIDIDGYKYRISIYFENPDEPVIGNQWCLFYKPKKNTEKSHYIDDVPMYATDLIECAVLMVEWITRHNIKLNEI